MIVEVRNENREFERCTFCQWRVLSSTWYDYAAQCRNVEYWMQDTWTVRTGQYMRDGFDVHATYLWWTQYVRY